MKCKYRLKPQVKESFKESISKLLFAVGVTAIFILIGYITSTLFFFSFQELHKEIGNLVYLQYLTTGIATSLTILAIFIAIIIIYAWIKDLFEVCE